MTFKRLFHKVIGYMPPTCLHDWRKAGPETRLSTIIQEIEGLSFHGGCGDSAVYVDGDRSDPHFLDPHFLKRYGERFQGVVCIKCGECIDYVELRRLHWIGVRDKVREERRLEAIETKIIEDLWNACPKRK